LLQVTKTFKGGTSHPVAGGLPALVSLMLSGHQF